MAKGKAIDEATTASTLSPAEDHSLLFNAILYPNRSLPNNGFKVIMAIVIAVNFFCGVYYTLLGAWPIIFFAGLDILLVWGAFKLSYRQGRMHETLKLTEEALWVSRVLPSGHETRWRLEPYWTDVQIDSPIRHGSQLLLKSHGRHLNIGSFLSPPEKAALGEALSEALHKAKSAPQSA